jgi:DNA-binding response OmpR family regulator
MSDKKLRILIVDDEADVRDTLCENLLACGFEATSAVDGIDAEHQMSENLPDLVITDIIMPRREGLETIVEIRRKYPQVKLIAISGGGRMNTTDFLALAEKLGADGVLAKPIELDELEKMIRIVTR